MKVGVFDERQRVPRSTRVDAALTRGLNADAAGENNSPVFKCEHSLSNWICVIALCFSLNRKNKQLRCEQGLRSLAACLNPASRPCSHTTVVVQRCDMAVQVRGFLKTDKPLP